MRIHILHMRAFHEEDNSSKACNDADSGATVRQRVHRISLTRMVKIFEHIFPAVLIFSLSSKTATGNTITDRLD